MNEIALSKTLLLPLIALAILWRCGESINRSNYELEDKVLQCFYHSYQQENINVKAKIDSAESVLVRHGVLKGSTATSYYQLIVEINKLNGYPFKITEELYDDIEAIHYLPSGIGCYDSTFIQMEDSSLMKGSKLRSIVGIFDSVAAKGDISPVIVTEEILEVFDERDFEHEYYRTLGVITLVNLARSRELNVDIIEKTRKPPWVE